MLEIQEYCIPHTSKKKNGKPECGQDVLWKIF